MHQDALKERLLKATCALEGDGVPYAVIGGQAVAHYVATVDPDAVRSTPNVDLLMDEKALARAQASLAPAGFTYRKAAGVHMFLDTPAVRGAVHVVIGGAKVRPEYAEPTPPRG